MREIKFRAWDKSDEMMYHDVQHGIFFEDDSHYGFEKFLGHMVGEGDYHEWEIMQSTGLFDSNGVEIYSGDIIRDERGEIGVIVDFDYGQQYMWLNEYRGWIKGELLVIADAVGDMQTASWLEGNEIIGNIHQHPHLLNKD